MKTGRGMPDVASLALLSRYKLKTKVMLNVKEHSCVASKVTNKVRSFETDKVFLLYFLHLSAECS